MKTKIFSILWLVILSFQLQAIQSMDGVLIAESDSIGFTIEPSIGFLNGVAREIVYKDNSSDTYLSELIWDLTEIVYAGLSASINIQNRLYLNIGFWTSINAGSGYMNDFDWLNLTGKSYPVYDDYDRSGWTNWSLSSVDVVRSLLLDVNISYDFLSQRNVRFSPMSGYRRLYWDWSDRVLDSIYPPEWRSLEVGADAIDYELLLNILYMGFGVAGYYPDGVFLDWIFIYSPFVFGGDHDHHLLRDDYGPGGIHFYDNIYFGQYLSTTVKIGYSFSEWFCLSTKFSGEYLIERRGSTYVYDNEGNSKGSIAGGAGIQYQALSISINAAFSF
ncbi:MAG: omptin family outer membrane protease [Spirochaetaceae bacterium]|nr:omptin family outer membrane protease [Spirochaetaceae bacterium]